MPFPYECSGESKTHFWEALRGGSSLSLLVLIRLRQDHRIFQASLDCGVRSCLKKQGQTITITKDLLPECLGTVAFQVEMVVGEGRAWAADSGNACWERQALGGARKHG